jgi:hypothetical protein
MCLEIECFTRMFIAGLKRARLLLLKHILFSGGLANPMRDASAIVSVGLRISPMVSSSRLLNAIGRYVKQSLDFTISISDYTSTETLLTDMLSLIGFLKILIAARNSSGLRFEYCNTMASGYSRSARYSPDTILK